MKKGIAFLLALSLLLSLSACTGIGDGALYVEKTSGFDAPNDLLTDIDGLGSSQEAEGTDCYLTTYTGEGERIMQLECSAFMMSELEKLFYDSAYMEMAVSPAEGQQPDYIEVSFPASSDKKDAEVFRVYQGSDAVERDGAPKGVISGAYQKVCDTVGILTDSGEKTDSFSCTADIRCLNASGKVWYRNVIRGYDADDVYKLITEISEYDPVSAPYTLTDTYITVDFDYKISSTETQSIRYEVYSNGITRRVYVGFSDDMTVVLGKNNELYDILKDIAAGLASGTTAEPDVTVIDD